MQKIIIPSDSNPQGPWAREAASEAWRHPKCRKRSTAPDPTAQPDPATPLTEQDSNQETEAKGKHKRSATPKRRATDRADTGGSKAILADDTLLEESSEGTQMLTLADFCTPLKEPAGDSAHTLAGNLSLMESLALEFTELVYGNPDDLSASISASDTSPSTDTDTCSECNTTAPDEIAKSAIETSAITREQPEQIADGKQLLAKVAELRLSVTQLLERQRDLDARRKIFLVVAYDGLLQAGRRMLASIDERLGPERKVEQSGSKEMEAWERAMLDAAAALIESGADLIPPKLPDTQDVQHKQRKKSPSKPPHRKHIPNRRRRKYLVQVNETFESIASDQLMNADMAPLIYQINRHLIVAKGASKSVIPALVPGLLLHLPSESEVLQFNNTHQQSDNHSDFETP